MTKSGSGSLKSASPELESPDSSHNRLSKKPLSGFFKWNRGWNVFMDSMNDKVTPFRILFVCIVVLAVIVSISFSKKVKSQKLPAQVKTTKTSGGRKCPHRPTIHAEGQAGALPAPRATGSHQAGNHNRHVKRACHRLQVGQCSADRDGRGDFTVTD